MEIYGSVYRRDLRNRDHVLNSRKVIHGEKSSKYVSSSNKFISQRELDAIKNPYAMA